MPTPPRAPRIPRLALAILGLGLVFPPPVHAARVGIFTEQERLNARADQISRAIETGDAARLQELVSAHPTPVPIAAHARLTPALARAYLLLGQTERARLFALDAYARTQTHESAWLAAELLYTSDQFALGDRIARELKKRAPHHPALPYLEVRRLLASLSLGDADSEWPTLRAQIPAARQAAELAASFLAEPGDSFSKHADPRFLTAGLDLALLELDYARASEFSARLSALRPRNPGLARLALACAFPVDARRAAVLDQIRTQDSLPLSEQAQWAEFASRLASPAEPRSTWSDLVKATADQPILSMARLVFLERALAAALDAPPAPRSSPEIAELLRTYGDAAREARSFPHAIHAVALRDELRRSASTFPALPEDEDSVRLLSLAARHQRAAALALALLPSNRDDFEWLARNRPAAAKHQDTTAYLEYLHAMERLRPEDPRTLLELARALDRSTDPRALDAYHRVFELCPVEIRPKASDWFALANLLKASADRGERSLSEAALAFDAMTERIHQADVTYAVAAHFYADLLDRRARAEGSPAARRAADEALGHALRLDPFAGDFFAKLGRTRPTQIP